MKRYVAVSNTVPKAAGAVSQIVDIGRFPRVFNSVCAEVLARFLDGEELTSGDAWDGCSSMRLAAHVHYLVSKYEWPIVSEARNVSCSDGRVASIAGYRLPEEVIAQARLAGAGIWCVKVRSARAERRSRQTSTFFRASRLGFLRRESISFAQGDLFQEVCGGKWAQ